jgi:hypothetical protein
MIKILRFTTMVIAFTAATVGLAASSASAESASQSWTARELTTATYGASPNKSVAPTGEVGTRVIFGPYPTFYACLADGAAGVAAGYWVDFRCAVLSNRIYLITIP